MMGQNSYHELKAWLDQRKVNLVAVSKTQSIESILNLYQLGQRIFGENRVQELLEKQPQLPSDIQWHLIGHLQSNKVKQAVPIVAMIHSVDSIKLLSLLEKEAAKANRILPVLLQVKISPEATKYGFDEQTIIDELKSSQVTSLSHIQYRGLMGMASFVDDETIIRQEFSTLKAIFEKLKAEVFNHATDFDQISMGMSGDYQIAVEEGSTMVRIGSLIFGERK